MGRHLKYHFACQSADYTIPCKKIKYSLAIVVTIGIMADPPPLGIF